MTRYLLLSLFTLAIAQIGYSQLSLSSEMIYPSVELGEEAIITIQISNNSDTDIDVEWTRTENLPDGWYSYVCDPEFCYEAAQSSATFFMPRNSEMPMKLYLYADELETGSVILDFKEVGNDDNNVTATYNATSFPVSNDNIARNPIKVYPNPATDYIEFSEADHVSSMEIYNIIGKKVMVYDNVRSSTPYDVSGLDNGMYLIRLLDDDGEEVVTKRINKQ